MKRTESGQKEMVPVVPEKRARFERTQDILEKSGLLEITKNTALLIKSNQQAHIELQQLNQEVQEFVRSVLSNPENNGSTNQARNSFLLNPLDQPGTSPSPQISVIKQHQSSTFLECTSSQGGN
ncbi:uncharacterized protein LOC111695017 [Eurytemora carolleeae]|uniref:uncharacterized protein LOC111695017 n=1 Tax=Eurytemora carolleeae TaxID=1294199 RepID=UPI000C758F4B|nr:uncharacterized protein LOC111695017 [Eurytemora carolleeae]|eukprot:XP_023319915.1 uncharacterized protein LOC111695017 [Eurytemora affinis]